jgi:hypothetical protein
LKKVLLEETQEEADEEEFWVKQYVFLRRKGDKINHLYPDIWKPPD